MMPLFFHSQAHLWIFYALFVNGLLLHRILFEYSTQYQELSLPFEAQVVIGFAFSLAINGLLLLSLDMANLPFSLAIYPLLTLTILCLSVVIWRKLYRVWPVEINWVAIVLYAAMFVILFYNGGMIDQVSDAWWHMSLANKIAWANSYTLEYGHLTGAPERYYPPLWHGNLALLRELSDQGLPIIWNAFTAWGGALKLMAYYLMGSAIFRDKKIGLIGAILFALLPGIGNSYMRVSAWPSHLAYILWFFTISLGVSLIDTPNKRVRMFEHVGDVARNYVLLILLAFCLLLIFCLHQFEVLVFCVCLFLYLLGLSVYGILTSNSLIVSQPPLHVLIYRLGLAILVTVAVFSAFQLDDKVTTLDYKIALMLPVVTFCLLFVADVISSRFRASAKFIILILFFVLLASVNYQHLASIAMPELALPKGASGEMPLIAEGLFGGKLGLPGWHLQLRAGLLWSGVVAIVISVAMVFVRPTRAWIFAAANCCFVWLLCASPYLYQWLTDVLAYHSVWRFAMLSFHPLIVAGFAVFLWQCMIPSFRPSSVAFR